MVLQANSPMRTKWMPAFSISSRSAFQRASGHCSGYHAVPSQRGVCNAGEMAGVATWDIAAETAILRHTATTAERYQFHFSFLGIVTVAQTMRVFVTMKLSLASDSA